MSPGVNVSCVSGKRSQCKSAEMVPFAALLRLNLKTLKGSTFILLKKLASLVSSKKNLAFYHCL